MIKITYDINMTCTSESDDLVEPYIEEAKMYIVKGLTRDLKRLYGVKVDYIKVEVNKIER